MGATAGGGPGTVGARPYGVVRARSAHGRLARRQDTQGPSAGSTSRSRCCARSSRIAREQEVDAVLVAGDLYDSAAPSRRRAAARGPHADGAGRHRGPGHRDRRQPRPRGHARRVPAARRSARASRWSGIGAHGRGRAASSSSPRGPPASGRRSRCCRSCPSATRCAPPSWWRSTPAENTGAYDQQLATSLGERSTAGFRDDAVNLVMAHLTVLGGHIRRRRAGRAVDLRVRGAGGDLPGRRALRRAGPPAPAAVDAAPVPGALLRLRRWPSTSASRTTPPSCCLVEAAPDHAGPGHRHPDHRGAAAADGARHGGRAGRHARRASATTYLRVWVREPARAGLREEVTDAAAERAGGADRPGVRRAGRAVPAQRRHRRGPQPGRAVPRVPGHAVGRRPAGRGAVRAAARPGQHGRGGHLMRPVLLEMDGFASFREPTVVDFAGADYFALVGPTGAGQVHGDRRDDVRAVRLGAPLGRPAQPWRWRLAPTVSRGVGAAGVRRRRRSATSPLGSCAAPRGAVSRQQRPAGAAARPRTTVDGDDDRARSRPTPGSTKAVEELLGLPFEHFCTCVVLPQGDFAEFLHAKPRKRQEKLVRLLGLGPLRRHRPRGQQRGVGRGRAGRRCWPSSSPRYADATDEAVGEADERVVGARQAGGAGRGAAPGAGGGGGGGRPGGRRRRDAGGRARPPGCAGRTGRAGRRSTARRRDAEERVRTARARFVGRRGRRRCRTEAPRGCARSPSAGTGPARAHRPRRGSRCQARCRRGAGAARAAEEKAARQVGEAEEAATAAAAARDSALGALGAARHVAGRVAERARPAGRRARARGAGCRGAPASRGRRCPRRCSRAARRSRERRRRGARAAGRRAGAGASRAGPARPRRPRLRGGRRARGPARHRRPRMRGPSRPPR